MQITLYTFYPLSPEEIARVEKSILGKDEGIAGKEQNSQKKPAAPASDAVKKKEYSANKKDGKKGSVIAVAAAVLILAISGTVIYNSGFFSSGLFNSNASGNSDIVNNVSGDSDIVNNEAEVVTGFEEEPEYQYDYESYEEEDPVEFVSSEEETIEREPISTIINHEIGDKVYFGEYIWYIIEKNDNRVTLLCKDSVATQPFNSEAGDTTWEKCSLRKWLNEDFYNSFTDEEKAYIVKTTCENKANSEYNTSGGNNTEDYVFLLSLDEAKKLKKSILATRAWWWLRSPGYYQYFAAKVNRVGEIRADGGALSESCSVRPALNLEF